MINNEQLIDREERKIALELLECTTFFDYLQTELWKSLRERRLAGSTQCLVCNKLASHLYFANYRIETFRGDSKGTLLTMCNRCRGQVEVRGGCKLWPCDSNILLLAALMNDPAKHAVVDKLTRTFEAVDQQRRRESCQPKSTKKKADSRLTRHREKLSRHEQHAKDKAERELKQKQRDEIQSMLRLTPAQRALVQAMPKQPFVK